MSEMKFSTYEEGINRLNEIMNDIQSGALSIDDMSAVLREAKEIVKFCSDKLYKVDKDIAAVIEDINNRL